MTDRDLLGALFPLAIDLIRGIIDACNRGDDVEARRLIQEALARQAFEERMRGRK